MYVNPSKFSSRKCLICQKNLRYTTADYRVCYDHIRHFSRPLQKMVRGRLQNDNKNEGILRIFITIVVLFTIGLNVPPQTQFIWIWNILLISGIILLAVKYWFIDHKYIQWISEMAKDPHPELRYPNLPRE